ncbi:unnamed protein product [Rhizoctonia solani]|uniref:Laminin domain protein n=1 Tax=Rhizoctonia solani TaxID=456999 RepID=A0A8H3A9C8_9AGAM|nr:unnamed protein product [Rhizoctonia solani]
MHDPSLIMKLGDHLFGAQMARYRSRYSLITFPSDATYTPPAMPTHLIVNLGPIHGAPSDEEIMKVQDAFQTYQEFRRVPSMFDAHVNMELSQHLFDIQMARYMRLAGESPLNTLPQATASVDNPSHNPARNVERIPNRTHEEVTPTNNAGTGANTVEIQQTPDLALGLDTRELMGQSNQLAERFKQLLERSNELMERWTRPEDSHSQTIAERFNQVLERLTQLVEQSYQPAERSDRLTERFNELFERFNRLTEHLNQPAQRAEQLTAQLNRSSERSNQLSEQANKTWERLGDVLGNINRVLVGVQHAIVRNHRGNKISALDCLVNEKGGTPATSDIMQGFNFMFLSKDSADDPKNRLPVMIDGETQDAYIPDLFLGNFIQFYGINNGVCTDATSVNVKDGFEGLARGLLQDHLSSCLG